MNRKCQQAINGEVTGCRLTQLRQGFRLRQGYGGRDGGEARDRSPAAWTAVGGPAYRRDASQAWDKREQE